MCPDVLPGEHGRTCRHADGILVVGAPIVDAGACPSVDHRRTRDGAAVASQGVVALLVGGDEQDLASHGRFASVPRAILPPASEDHESTKVRKHKKERTAEFERSEEVADEIHIGEPTIPKIEITYSIWTSFSCFRDPLLRNHSSRSKFNAAPALNQAICSALKLWRHRMASSWPPL